MTDAELLSEFLLDRDESAFATLVRRHGPMVLRLCRDVLSDRGEAEDAFQATFLVLVRQADAIRDRSSLGPWLYEVAWRISRRARAQAARRRVQERQVQAMAAAETPEADPARHELKPLLHEEIGRLPGKFRDPIVLCYLEGLTVEEAAGRIGCPVGTLKSRLVRGRETRRGRLSRRGVAVSAVLLLFGRLEQDATASALPESLVGSTVRAGVDQALGSSAATPVAERISKMVRDESESSRRPTLTLPGLVILALLLLSWLLQAPADRTARAASSGAGSPALVKPPPAAFAKAEPAQKAARDPSWGPPPAKGCQAERGR